MRILKMLVITIAIVSLETIATAQTTAREINMGYIKTIYKVPMPTVGSTKIDPTKVKFLSIAPCRVEYGASSDGTTIVMRVMGIVGRDVELSDDAIAQQLLQMEIAFGREQCPPGGEFYDDGVLKRDQSDRNGNLRPRSISLSLYFGDPTTFTSADIQKFFDDRKRWIRGNTAYDQLLDNVYGYWRDDKPDLIINYTNYIKHSSKTEPTRHSKQESRKPLLSGNGKPSKGLQPIGPPF